MNREWGIRRRATQLAGALGAAALLVLLAQPAAAQFVCTTTATDSTCTNSGTAGALFMNGAVGATQNATTTNSGTAAGFEAATLGGNATATNTGTNVNPIAGGTGMFVQTNNGGNATATNTGSNSSNGTGILVRTGGGGNATATNTGSNSGGGAGFQVITLGGGNATLTNTGSNSGAIFVLTQSGGNATAINTGSDNGDVNFIRTVAGGNASMTNTGSVNGLIGTSANTGNATNFNSGLVTGQVSATTTTGNAMTINTGTIVGPVITTTTTGNATTNNSGLLLSSIVTAATNGNATFNNSGTLQGQANVSAGTMATVTNSGAISNFGGTAIQLSGTADTLNVLPGSSIIGAINLIGANDTVNILSPNQALTFNTLAGATVTSTVPFVVSGNRAVTIDPTPFGLADKSLMDFTRAVSGILDGVGGGAAPSGPLSSAFAPLDGVAARFESEFGAIQAPIPGMAYASDAMVFKNPTFVAADGRAVWARGFGGERTQEPDAQNGLVGAHTSFFGGAVGFDMVARSDLRLGLFAGGGESRLSLDGNAGFTNADMAFGGLYGRWSFVSLGRASFLDFSLHGGGGNNSTSRTVSNNLVAGGLEIATASYNSSYITPELKYGLNIPLWARYTLTPSVGVRYVAGFFGGYTEAGTTAPVTVASRTIQDFEERGELKLTRATPVGPDLLLTSAHVGAIGLERVGDTTVDATILGVGLPFVTPGRDTVGGLVSGGGLEWRTRAGVSLFGAGEAIWFSDSSTVWSARGGVRVAF